MTPADQAFLDQLNQFLVDAGKATIFMFIVALVLLFTYTGASVEDVQEDLLDEDDEEKDE